MRLHDRAGLEFDEREHHLVAGGREDVNPGKFVLRRIFAGNEVRHSGNFGFWILDLGS